MRRRASAAPSELALSDEGGQPASRMVDVEAVTSLVQRELGLQNPSLGEAQAGDALLAASSAGDALLAASSASEVLALMATADPSMLTIDDVALACRRIALRAGTITDAMVEDWAFQRFLERASTVVRRSDFEPHHVATLLWAIAALRESLPEIQGLLRDVCGAVPSAAPEMNVQNLTTSFISVSKLQQHAWEVTDVAGPLLDALVDRASSIEPAQLSAVIWAAGEMELPDEQAFELTGALLRGLTPEHLRQLQSRDLANFVWGLANLGVRDTVLLQAVADVVSTSVPKMSQKGATLDLPMLVCGFQRLTFRDTALIQAAAERLRKRNMIRKMNDWGLCALAWAWPDRGDDIFVGTVRSIRDVIDAQLARKQHVSRTDVERSVRGPSRWQTED